MSSGVFPDPAKFRFPDWVEIGDYVFRSHDVVSFGMPLTGENVREAYGKGIFPWYTEGIPLPWHCPEQRAILEFADLHIPRSLERERRRRELAFTIDRDLPAVIRACAEVPRAGQLGTWITPEFERVYTELHHEGLVHSVEAWDPEGELVGGLYGVDAGGVFCGESMFYRRSNASKLTLLFLIDHLASRGAKWLDAQVMTPHLRSLGAKEISRTQFLNMLRQAQAAGLKLFEQP